VPILPQAQKDQVKLIVGILAVALSAYYYLYPYTGRAAELAVIDTHVTQLDEGVGRVAGHHLRPPYGPAGRRRNPGACRGPR